MPLNFTNLWDQNFPADNAFVLQGAANLRQLRVDVQQRMAAISGTDAAKPNFSADAQATQWLGILYFALDTARVYQWDGTAWLDVTAQIGSGGGGGTPAGGVSTYFEFSNPALSIVGIIEPVTLMPSQIAVNNHLRVMVMVEAVAPFSPASVGYGFAGQDIAIAQPVQLNGGYVWANFDFFLNTNTTVFGFGWGSTQSTSPEALWSAAFAFGNIPNITQNNTPFYIRLNSGGPISIPTVTMEVFS